MWRRAFRRRSVARGHLAATAALACAALALVAPLASSAPATTAAPVITAVPHAAGAADLKGALSPSSRPLLVHAWATWCAPCVAEWPRLAAALREYGQAVDVLTISLDVPGRRGAAARILAGAGRVPGRALLVPVPEAFPVLKALDPEWDGAVPATWLLRPDRRVALAQRGGTRLPALAAEIEKMTRHGAAGARE